MTDAKRILVVKLGDLGDVLLAEPALRSLQAGHPNAQIDLLTTPSGRPVADLIGLSGDIQVMDRQPERAARSMTALGMQSLKLGRFLAKRRYDAVVLLNHLTTRAGTVRLKAIALASRAPQMFGLDNGRGGFLTEHVRDFGFGHRHEVEYMLDVALLAGGDRVDPAPRLRLPEVSIPRQIHSGGIVIAPVSGTYAPARDWPLARYADLVAALVSELDDEEILIVGDDAAREAGKALSDVGRQVHDLTGQTSVPELAQIVADARLVIANDSFPGHLAAAFATSLVTIFGPSNSASWRPFGSTEAIVPASSEVRQVVVSSDLPCSPCLYTGHRLGRRFGCPTRTCLTSIEVSTVMNAVHRALPPRT